MNLSPRFDHALNYAVLIHAGQKRKCTDIPYIAHLLGVVAIALEYGATEDEAIGALLHDAGEDAGGADRIEDIRHRFGDANCARISNWRTSEYAANATTGFPVVIQLAPEHSCRIHSELTDKVALK